MFPTTEDFRVVERLVQYYEEFFDGSVGQQYLVERGFDPEFLASYRVGFSPRKWQFEGTESELERLEALGYLDRSGTQPKDNYAGRIMFPVCDAQGRPRGFSGRITRPSGPVKYMNSNERDIFKKGELLFGFHHARKSIFLNDKAIICEGFTDALAFHQTGAKIAVAVMGTALTEFHIRTLARYCSKLYFAFDADKSGNKALKKSVEAAKEFGIAYGLFPLPAGQDPADVLLKAK